MLAKLIRLVADKGILLCGGDPAVTACLQWTQPRISDRVVCHCNICIRVLKGIFGALF